MNHLFAKLLVAITGFLSLSAQAAPVTIDFSGLNEFATIGNSFQEPNGYSFTNTSGGFVCVGTGCGPGGEVLRLLSAPAISMVRSDGALFDLLSMDAFLSNDSESCGAGACYGDSVTISAWDQNDNLIAQRLVNRSEPTTVVFDTSWIGIARLTYNAQDCLAGACEGAIDNIQVNVVPIPAAVWLFGSALAGLGWIKRKQTF